MSAVAPSRSSFFQSRRQLESVRACFCFPLVKNFSFFLRNLTSDFLQYIGERPEMASHDGTSKKAKTRKGKLKPKMKTKNMTTLHLGKSRISCRLAPSLIVLVALAILIPWSAQAATITTIDVPGAGLTSGQGNNDGGNIVGFYNADAAGLTACSWLSIRKGSLSDH